MALQLRRGTNQQRLGLTPVEGEMIYITDSVLVSISVTGIDAGTETLTTSVEHGLSLNQQIKFIGTTLNGLTKDQVYFVKTTPTTTTFTLSTTLGGGTLNITGTYSVPLVFAKTPCDASGAPIGYTESALWAGDGTTVGGLAVGITNLDALNDVDITEPAVEGEFLWYDGTNWINENATTVDTSAKTLSLTRRYTSAAKEYESPIAQKLNGRITNVTNDNTDDAGPALRFERSSGTQYTKTYVSGGAIGAFTVTLNNVTNLVVGNKVTGTGLPQGNGALITIIAGNQLTLDTAFTVQASGTYTIGAPVGFGQLAFEYYGTTDVHRFKVTTSTDDYLENPADTYPGTNTLIESTKNYTNINDGVLYVDKTNVRIGINDTGPDYDVSVYKPNNVSLALINSEREFVLTNDASNDQLSFAWGAVNRLQFNIPNSDQSFPTGRLGVATASPNYTLDVNGTANIETSLTVPSISTLTGDDLTITAFAGRDVTISTTTAADPVTIVRNTATTNAFTRALTLRTNSSGTPAVGFGSALDFEIETAPNVTKAAGFIEVEATNVTTGDETFRMNFGLMNDNNTYDAVASLTSLGNLQIDGTLEIDGNKIRNSTGNDTITMGTGATGLVTLSGNLTVSGNQINSSSGLAITMSGSDVTIGGSLTAANYNTSNAGTISLFNTNATAANVLGDATGTISIGNTSGTLATNGKLNVGITLQTPSKEDVANTAAMSIGTASSYFSTGAAGETATLAAGNEGQFKSLAMFGDGGGNMVVTVTNPGWGGAGTITFNDIGDSCLLHYINGKWFAVGANGVAFA
jgi:hypothetical protein